jgi:uncharacterized DUF497 family protein
MIYDWDKYKAEINLKIHRVSFEEATLIFEDFFALEQFDDAHSTIDEQRFVRLGLANDKVLFVVYSMRGKDEEVYRIISARFADQDEEKMYWEERYGK